MKKELLLLACLIISGSLTADCNRLSNLRIDPEVIILDEAPKEKYPLQVSGFYTIKIEPLEETESKQEDGPNFQISNHFERTDAYYVRDSLRVADGWLVALDAGEWGAWFGWYSDSGEDSYKISSMRVFEFTRINGELYVFGGGCGGNDGGYGFLAKMLKTADTWELSDVERFPLCVLSISETKNPENLREDAEPTFLVLTADLIYEWKKSRGKKLLYGHIGWHAPDRGTWDFDKGLHKKTNSIARDINGNIFIGTDRGVVVIQIDQGREINLGLKDFPPPPPPKKEKEDAEDFEWDFSF